LRQRSTFETDVFELEIRSEDQHERWSLLSRREIEREQWHRQRYQTGEQRQQSCGLLPLEKMHRVVMRRVVDGIDHLRSPEVFWRQHVTFVTPVVMAFLIAKNEA